MSEAIQYPQIKVKLAGEDSNAFSIMGRVITAIREGLRDTYSRHEISEICDAYRKDATSGDYDHLLQVTMNYVSVY